MAGFFTASVVRTVAVAARLRLVVRDGEQGEQEQSGEGGLSSRAELAVLRLDWTPVAARRLDTTVRAESGP
jgi:hypothetical protein